MQWAMVPLYPKALTPPARGHPTASAPAANCVGSMQAVFRSAASTCELRARSWAFGVVRPMSNLNISRTSPDKPAAGSEWPTQALTVVTSSSDTRAWCRSTAAARAPASIGSPRADPLAAASRWQYASLWMRASARAPFSTPCCALPLGAVRLALFPSCRTQLPCSAMWQGPAPRLLCG
eukprot:scaffold22390_cov28-Tisochrysis_lutea.AAC.3